jgi:hypothetical protein
MNSSLCAMEGNGNKDVLIVSFGGISKQFAGTPPFEFLRFLHQYFPQYDKHFYIDIHQQWYHKGINGFSTNIIETQQYLQNIIRNYKNILFVGISAGGYAAILFGSLLKINTVIAFIPQTKLRSIENGLEMDGAYLDLRNFICSTTQYYIYGNPTIIDETNHHHISHCENIADLSNVQFTRIENLDLPKMRDNGELYIILREIILK